jgi:hypothetical protein
MPRFPSPALAFYLKHAADYEALWEIDEPPHGVLDADWKKFEAVRTKASEQAAELLIACRDEAMSAFSPRFSAGAKTQPKTVQQNWFAWGELTGRKPKTLNKFYVGCALGADPTGLVCLQPYVAPGRVSERPELLSLLRGLRLPWEIPTAEWLEGDDSITLCLVPLRPESDLNELSGACAKPFRELAKTL